MYLKMLTTIESYKTVFSEHILKCHKIIISFSILSFYTCVHQDASCMNLIITKVFYERKS